MSLHENQICEKFQISYITINFVLATDVNPECQKFRSREKQEIKREKMTENVKRQNVLEQNVKRRERQTKQKKPRAPQYSSAQLTAIKAI